MVPKEPIEAVNFWIDKLSYLGSPSSDAGKPFFFEVSPHITLNDPASVPEAPSKPTSKKRGRPPAHQNEDQGKKSVRVECGPVYQHFSYDENAQLVYHTAIWPEARVEGLEGDPKIRDQVLAQLKGLGVDLDQEQVKFETRISRLINREPRKAYEIVVTIPPERVDLPAIAARLEERFKRMLDYTRYESEKDFKHAHQLHEVVSRELDPAQRSKKFSALIDGLTEHAPPKEKVAIYGELIHELTQLRNNAMKELYTPDPFTKRDRL